MNSTTLLETTLHENFYFEGLTLFSQTDFNKKQKVR